MRRVAVLLLVSALAPAPGAADVDHSHYRSELWGVELLVPADWQLAEQQAYPGILVSAWSGDGKARMTLAAERLTTPTTTQGYGNKNRRTLEKIGFRVVYFLAHPSGAHILDAVAPNRRTRMKQAYWVEGDTAFVLSLAAPRQLMRASRRTFEDTLEKVRFIDKLPITEVASSQSPCRPHEPPSGEVPSQPPIDSREPPNE